MNSPISPLKLAANRANAARSTGPRSTQGKTRSAQNARKHGFTATTFAVVRIEDLDEVAHLRDDAIAFYRPANSQELFAVERIALAQQALLRAERLAVGFFTTCANETLDGDGHPLVRLSSDLVNEDNEITKAQNRNYLLAEGFDRMNRHSNSFPLLLRYQVQAERHYRRAVEEFERLRSFRNKFPNEPTEEVEPEGRETTSLPSGTPEPKPSPAGNVPGQPKRYRPDGELVNMPRRRLLPPAPELDEAASDGPADTELHIQGSSQDASDDSAPEA